MAEAAVLLAVETLGNLAIQKVGSLQGVEGQVNWLRDELKRMQSFLRDADQKQADDERVRNWISEIRELAQDAEDVVDTFILKVETPRSRGLLGRWASFPQHVYHLNRLAQEIETVQARLRAIEESRQRYGIQDLGGGINSSRRSVDGGKRQFTPWKKDKHLVGLDRDIKLLLRGAVLEEREELSVATIVGMGGIGKSTLAREVYNHAAVAAQFDCRAWAVVSREFNPREILKSLTQQLVEREKQQEILEIMEKSDLQNVKNMLHQQLKGKRFFIVLDDVWQDEAWESLAGAFPDEDNSSRLLLTSRIQDIAKYARYNHMMKFLDPDESWQLFLKKAFIGNTDRTCSKELEDTGREILKKCNGLPLAIAVVGGLLVKRRQSKSEWEKVLKGLESHLGRSECSVSATLELSYHDLPPHLKSCFLCLGFFKEDAIIRVTKLVNLWVVEGLVRQEGEGKQRMMEEIARSYLDELINRNMVQVKEMMSKGDRVKSCYIHDLLHELSRKKAKEEIGFEITREGNSQSSNKARHRAIYCQAERFIKYSENSNMHLRSLFVHGAGMFDQSPSYWKSFGLLRVLDFEDFELTNLPDTIGALTWLRYLGLRNTNIKKLPMSLGRLNNLQVLDIARNKAIKVPNVIWEMTSLRHLYMSEIICKMPLKIDTLTNLQTLTYIYADYWSLELPAQMTSLHKLGIELDEYTDVGKLFASLAMLDNLVCLNLKGLFNSSIPSLDQLITLRHVTQLKIDGYLKELPPVSNFPPNLSYLSLVGNFLKQDPMPVLQKLPELLYLKLDDYAYTGKEIVISQEGFPRLKVLSLHRLTNLRNMQVERGAMPELNRLEICNCPYLESLPEELRFMTSLDELKMMTSAKGASKLQDHVASHIISNIPSVNLIVLPYSHNVTTKTRFVFGRS